MDRHRPASWHRPRRLIAPRVCRYLRLAGQTAHAISPSLPLVTPSILGAVLAGGRSTRMGQDKADVLVQGSTMLEMVATAVRPVSDQLIVLGPDREGWDCWPDSFHAQGPLAGVATALARTDKDHVVLVAVDHPFVTTNTLRHLVEMADGLPIVPVDDHGVRQVTCAVYPKTIADAASQEAIGGGSVQSLLDRVSFTAVTSESWRVWGEDGRSWFSADDPESLSAGLSHFHGGNIG